MNDQERDELLLRLDERSVNTYRLCEKLEHHQETQNGEIQNNLVRSKSNLVRIRFLWGIGGTGFMTLISWLAKIQGLW